MPNLTTIALGFTALSLFFYLSGYKGFIIIGILLIILMGLIYFNQNKLLYMPVVPGLSKSSSQNPMGYRHPSERNLESVDLSLNTSDGVIIRGWHIKSKKNAQRIIVYFHQNAGNIGTRLDYVKQIVQRTESDVILVAYRGYSDSQSQPSEQGLMKDSYAVMEYAISYSQQHQKLPIYVLGRSLGGAVSVNLAIQQLYKDQIKGLILENTFTSISDMIDSIFPVLKYVKFLQTNYWPSLERITSIKAPIFFIKSVRDQIVPHEQMNRLMNAVVAINSTSVKQYKIKYGTHNSSWDVEPQVYFGKLIQFFTQLEK